MGYPYEERFKYFYEGPVLEFDKVVCENWVSKTYAPSDKKARSNLAYQFKKLYNRAPNAKITLPGKLQRVG